PALACQIAATRGNQRTMLLVDPRELAAQPLDHEMLEIEDPFADLARRRAQQAQRLGMTIEKIGVLFQIGDDFAAAELLRRGWRCQSSFALDLRLIARPVDHQRATSPCRESGGNGR